MFRRMAAVLAAVGGLALFLVLPALWNEAAQRAEGSGQVPDGSIAASEFPSSIASATSAPAEPNAEYSPDSELRGVWVSYLEWQGTDFSSEAAFRAEVRQMMQNITALGANTVFAHVRPFGDALYPSALFPFSHLCTGVQGQDPGFDPLAVLVEQAHAAGLELHAWINPYRLRSGSTPASFCAESPAVTHPDWVRTAGNGQFLDPSSAEVQQYLADSLAELCQNYSIDGIHFDDYFYPTTDPAFDAADYAASGTNLSLEDWRRENVNALMRLCRAVTQEYGVVFSVSPQGNLTNCRDAQYSDAALWLAEPGYCDLVIPQLYWGRDYIKNGSRALALDTLAQEWLTLPRCEETSLAFGLAASRIGEGDGGLSSGPGTEWCSGRALAEQITFLRAQGAGGTAVYRYDSLFSNTLYPTLAEQEADALRAVWSAP
ncbi:MAG: glycoside hydrolase family 10 protein [Gemmiger sp.]